MAAAASTVETLRQVSIHGVILRATFGRVSLFREYPEVPR